MKPIIRSLLFPLIAAAFIASASAQDTPVTLKVGDPAPPLKINAWIKGEPVTTLGHGKVNVVEFWATWCGPCRESIPHLTELAHKYKDQATFTGVSVFERPSGPDDNVITDVKKFVKDMGDKMDYHVAADGKTTVMGTSWMEAAGQGGIPTAFVVDQQGNIAWIGHPMAGLDEVVGKVIKGTFNAKEEAAKAEAARSASEAKQLAMQAEMKPLVDAIQGKKYGVAVTEIDKLMAKHPEMTEQLAEAKFQMLLQFNEPGAYAYAKELSQGFLKDNAPALNELAWTMIDEKSPLKKRDYPTGLYIAHRAAEVSKNEDPSILDTYALALFKVDEATQAVTIEQKAIGIATKQGADFPAKSLQEMKARLATFKSKAKA